MKTILESERLTFREMTFDDVDFIAGMLAHPEVMRYYPKCFSRAEAEEWISRQLGRYQWRGYSLWFVSDKATGEPVGQVGLIPQIVDEIEEAEIGYLIHYPYWRRGLATEAARAVRDYAFGDLNKGHVISLIRPVNVPSQGVAQKIGMHPSRKTFFHGYEHIVFLMTRSDWERR